MVLLQIFKSNPQPTFGVKDVTPNLTLLTPDVVLVLEVIDVIDSLELVLFNPDGGKPDPECTTQAPGLCLDGDLLTLEIGANNPKFGRHSKYLKVSF